MKKYKIIHNDEIHIIKTNLIKLLLKDGNGWSRFDLILYCQLDESGIMLKDIIKMMNKSNNLTYTIHNTTINRLQ